MGTNPLGIGIIGSGFMARTYAEVTSRYTPKARLAAIAVGRRAQGLAREYDVAYEPSVEQLLNRPDIEALIVTTPGNTHLEYTRLAVQAGKHLLVEKPLALDVSQCDEMISLCRSKGITLMAVQSQRYRGVNWRAKQLIDDGRIGNVRQVNQGSLLLADWVKNMVHDRPWYSDRRGDTLFLGQCVHNFDMMRWLAGAEPRSIYACGTTFGDQNLPNLTTLAIVQFDNGVLGHLWVSLEMPGVTLPRREFFSQVIGDEGILDFDGYNHLDMAVDGSWQRVWEQPAFDPLDPLDPVRLESFIAQNHAFVESLLSHGPPPVQGEDGRAAVHLCQACLMSVRTGQVVPLPL